MEDGAIFYGVGIEHLQKTLGETRERWRNYWETC